MLTECSYCFGAKHVCGDLAAGTVAAGAVGHPSALKEGHFKNLKGKRASHLYAYCTGLLIHTFRKGPLFLSCAETDHLFPPENRRKCVDILQALKKNYHVQLFSGIEHGFCVRCDLNDPYAREPLPYSPSQGVSAI